MTELPTGVVTFLFTDVQGSTRLWEDAPDVMMRALEQHDEAVDGAIEPLGGVSVKPRGEGDSRFIVFHTASDAVEAAAEIQRRLAATDWVTPRPIVVRAALHTGTADLQLGDYYGAAVNRAARLRGIAHGGQTIMSRATWELVQDQLPEGVTIRDLGEHGLKDLTRPAHVYQLDIAGLPDSFPALESLSAIPNNLPQQLTEFVGRTHELAETKRLLGQTRMLTIMAPGGTGKTRLAIQAAADLISDYPDGVFFIDLADVSAAGDIVQAMAEALGLGLATDDDVQTQLLAYLANKTQLLLFDNFEHLVDGAKIITAILKAASAVTCVATSRTKLNLSGETAMTLSGLETTWDTPEEAAQASGVALFVDAALRAHPGFVLEEADLGPLAEILELTGGIPLGILLSAAWVDMLPVDEIAMEIRKSLDFLETEMGDVPDRHRSVRAVFDYSWALLGEDERAAFTALSVFQGGFTREAAQAVAGASIRTIASLANKSLVTPNPKTGRYRVHELLRQYAEAELHSDEVVCAEVQDAHARHFSELLAPAMDMMAVADQPKLLEMIESDIDNVRAAWRHFLAQKDAVAAKTFLFGFYFLYEARGWYRSALELFDEALEVLGAADTDDDSRTLRAVVLANKGWFMTLLGQLDAGSAVARESVESLPDSADLLDYWVAIQSHALGLAYLGAGAEMAEACDAGIERLSQLDDVYWPDGMKNWRSFAALLTNDFETPMKLLPEGMATFDARNDHYMATWNLWLQALIATGSGRPQDAIDLHGRQVERAKQIGYRRGALVALEGLGDAHVAAGNPSEAEAAFIESMVIAEQMGMTREMLGMMTKVAKGRAEQGRTVEAVELIASVSADPISQQQTFADQVPIIDMATEALTEIESSMDPADYAAAHARGRATPFETMAKQVFDSA